MRDWWPELQEKIARTLADWERSGGDPSEERVERIPIVVGAISDDMYISIYARTNDNVFCGAKVGRLYIGQISCENDITTLTFGLRNRPWNHVLLEDGGWGSPVKKEPAVPYSIDFGQIP
jgi:hypothetical protein